MLTCGLKLTHDGAVALIEDGRLLFSVEIEKLSNNARFSAIHDARVIVDILERYGCSPDQVDEFVVDGWGGVAPDDSSAQERLTVGDNCNFLRFADHGEPYSLSVARYREATLRDDPIRSFEFSGLRIDGREYGYRSSLHVTGHVFAAYGTSPFAGNSEDAYVLVWDGGLYPRLYYVQAKQWKVECMGPLFPIFGNAYSMFARNFAPFRGTGAHILSIAGKVMAYIGLGNVQPRVIEILERLVTERNSHRLDFVNYLARDLKAEIGGESTYPAADVLLSFHMFLQQRLCETLVEKIRDHPRKRRNLCLSGGCALNIKWNSAIRAQGVFEQVYVPPFPNDSGSAIGAACASMFARREHRGLRWSAYSGPALVESEPSPGWIRRPCPVPALAGLLHETQEPVIVLDRNAELGPRALGARSILAAPTRAEMKSVLNRVKERESYRPVSPICLADRAPQIFDPGSPDPFMLFEHHVRPSWRARIPAVIHVDGTARLQTVRETENPTMTRLLVEYEALSEIPVLCNTSANGHGTGFFPDVRSATEWGRLNYVWSADTLFEREQKLELAGD